MRSADACGSSDSCHLPGVRSRPHECKGGLEGRPLVEDAIHYPEHLAYEEWQREQKAYPHYDEDNAWLELEALE